MSKYRFATIEESKEILFYDESRGVYAYGGEIIIEKELEEIYEFKLRGADIAEIKGHIQRKTYVKREVFDSDINIINLKNGLYNITTVELKSHDPDYYSINQKPFTYNPHARPKHFIKFLKEVLYSADIRTAIEIIAYTFLRYNLHEIYFILIGRGSNGKSVYTGLVTNLHGPSNISNVPLRALTDDRFALADLDNKDVNIDTELSSNSIKDMSILKKLTGKHLIRVQRKRQHAYDTILHAKLIFNANEMPINSDNTDAHYRREIILSFPNQFEGKNEDPDLLDKLSTEQEMSGIFNIIAFYLKRLIKTQRVYINEKTIKERRDKAQRIRDPVKAFLKDALMKTVDLKEYETKNNVYDAYSRFCNFHKLPKESYDTFGDILREKYGYEKCRPTIEGVKTMAWKGVHLIKWAKPVDPLQKTFSNEDDEDE